LFTPPRYADAASRYAPVPRAALRHSVIDARATIIIDIATYAS